MKRDEKFVTEMAMNIKTKMDHLRKTKGIIKPLAPKAT